MIVSALCSGAMSSSIPSPYLIQQASIMDYLSAFIAAGTEKNTLIIIHHTTARAEPDPMTAIQGGGWTPSDSLPVPHADGSDMTQTPLMGGLLLPARASATRRPPLVSHKTTGDATTQTRTTNALTTPQFKDVGGGFTAAWLVLKTTFTPHVLWICMWGGGDYRSQVLASLANELL